MNILINTANVTEFKKVIANIETILYQVIMDIIKTFLTDKGINKFLADYNK